MGFDSFNPQVAAMNLEDVVKCQSSVCMGGMLYRYSGQQVDGITEPRQFFSTYLKLHKCSGKFLFFVLFYFDVALAEGGERSSQVTHKIPDRHFSRKTGYGQYSAVNEGS